MDTTMPEKAVQRLQRIARCTVGNDYRKLAPEFLAPLAAPGSDASLDLQDEKVREEVAKYLNWFLRWCSGGQFGVQLIAPHLFGSELPEGTHLCWAIVPWKEGRRPEEALLTIPPETKLLHCLTVHEDACTFTTADATTWREPA